MSDHRDQADPRTGPLRSSLMRFWGVDLGSAEGQIIYYAHKEEAERVKREYDTSYAVDSAPHALVHLDLDVSDVPKLLRALLNRFLDGQRFPPQPEYVEENPT